MPARFRWMCSLLERRVDDVTQPAPAIVRIPFSENPLIYSRAAAGITILISVVVMLGGWGLNIASLRSLLPGLATMKFNTALGLGACGAALWLLGPEVYGLKRRIGQGFAIVAVIIGALTLLEYAFAWDLGIDKWIIFDKSARVANTWPGRPSPNSALAILLIGMALLMLDREGVCGRRLAEWFGLATGLIAYIALLGYIYGVQGLYSIFAYSTLALHTAIALLALSIGVLLARSTSSLLQVVGAADAGSIMARRLLPTALLIPPLLGWLLLLGERADWYNYEFGLALFSTALVVIFSMLIWVNANSLYIIDRRRWQAQEDLRRANEDLESRVSARTEELAKANEILHDEVAERERAEAKFHNLLKSAPDAIVTVDGEGRIVLVSQQAEKYFGYSSDELHGQSIEILIPEDLRKKHITHRANYLSTPRTRYMGIGLELLGKRKDGSTFPVEISLSPLQTDEGCLVTSVIRDITERKQAEVSLRNYAAQLESVNGELEAFSYSVSHDLRAPLRALDGFSHILLEDYADKLDEQGRNYLQRVRAAAQRMAALIDDLIKLSRVTRAELNRADVDLSELAQDIAQELRDSQPERYVEFAISPDLHANGDMQLLRVALMNLIANAWKFTSATGNAKIEFERSDRQEEPVFRVRDNGIGFDMSYAGKLFGAFQRLHDQRDYPGTGIGLATVQRVIIKHGGRIWAESAPGQGATFYFTL